MGENRTLVFIASLSHGGSTLLDMLLSGHPRICGVGEVARLIDPAVRAGLLARGRQRLCSCGQSVTPVPSCPLWAEFLAHLEARPGASLASHYAELLRVAERHAGGTTVVCDSSKNLHRLQALARAAQEPELKGVDLRVLHLMRDVRSFAASRRRRYRDSVPRLYRRMGEWYRTNRRIEAYLEGAGLSSLRVGYEEICLYPTVMLPKICAFLGVGYDPATTDLGASRGHVGIGNPMRTDPLRSHRLQYDHRWFGEDAIGLLHLLRPRVRRYNRERVYAHIPVPPRGERLGNGESGQED